MAGLKAETLTQDLLNTAMFGFSKKSSTFNLRMPFVFLLSIITKHSLQDRDIKKLEPR
jgi:hypothetical protein